VSLQAIGTGSGVLGFRPCWFPSPFTWPSKNLQESIRLVTNAWIGVRVGKRTGNNPKLVQLIVALLCNQIDMTRESELRIKHGTEVTDTCRECYGEEERGQPK